MSLKYINTPPPCLCLYQIFESGNQELISRYRQYLHIARFQLCRFMHSSYESEFIHIGNKASSVIV